MVPIFWFSISAILGPEFYFNWKDTHAELLKPKLNERITQSDWSFSLKRKYDVFI